MRKILFILGELDDADVDWLMRVGRKEKIETGSRLIQEGHPVDALYVVVSGEFQVVEEGLQGREIARLKSGEVWFSQNSRGGR
ncbi:MAG: cyclic nucleotide-binding domain-containing protein [Cyanobacteria bacterium]|nr:cyclic nucleotide-binding domain-containing protein [Cyanobacteriota bacterium]